MDTLSLCCGTVSAWEGMKSSEDTVVTIRLLKQCAPKKWKFPQKSAGRRKGTTYRGTCLPERFHTGHKPGQSTLQDEAEVLTVMVKDVQDPLD